MRKSGKKIILEIFNFLIFFSLIAFVVTSSFLLFLNEFEFTEQEISNSAKNTFWNIIFITLMFWLVDTIRRKLTVDLPVKRIVKGLNNITKGDFSYKIKPVQNATSRNKFNYIIKNINKMTEELAGVETLRTDFIANVSHELKTPLAVIQNYGTMLQATDLSESERMEYAKVIISTSNNLAALITNILKLNKLENQQIYPESKPYNLNEQLCECLLQFESAWEEKNITIETDMDEDVIINTDSELLSVVWNNLFSNAIKFSHDNGKIFVGLKKYADTVTVTITDHGCGMSKETGRHIFEKFYQGDTSHASKGNGLGLALVKRVIDILNGEISVQSEVGKGSTFTVKIRRGMETSH